MTVIDVGDTKSLAERRGTEEWRIRRDDKMRKDEYLRSVEIERNTKRDTRDEYLIET